MPTRRHLLLLVAAASACACAPDPASKGEGAIRDALAHQAEAWNRHDIRAWMEPFAEDAEFINIVGMALLGKREIEERHAQLFNGIFSRSRVVMTTWRVRSLGATAALSETDYELRGYDRLPPGIQPTDADGTLRTRMKNVWQLRPEGWRILAAQNTAIFPGKKP